MPSEFAPPGGKPRVTKQQIKQMQEQYKKAEALAQDTRALEAQEKADIESVFAAEFENVFETTQRVGVYIGRFQPLHLGHEQVLQTMLAENDKTLVIIGIGGVQEHNPFSLAECQDFLSKYASSDCVITEIADRESDTEWVAELWKIVESHTILNSSLHIYGGALQDDYAIQAIEMHWHEYSQTELTYTEVPRNNLTILVDGENLEVSGTLCRELIENRDWKKLEKLVSPSVFYSLKKKYGK